MRGAPPPRPPGIAGANDQGVLVKHGGGGGGGGGRQGPGARSHSHSPAATAIDEKVMH
jgi:hypothetical protein